MRLVVAYCGNCKSGNVSPTQKRAEQLAEAHSMQFALQSLHQVHEVFFIEIEVDLGLQRKAVVTGQS